MSLHDARWETLKSHIEALKWDPDKRYPLSEIVKIMKTEHDFDANEQAYKYRFRQWGWKRNMSASTKARAIDKLKRRVSSNCSADQAHQGRPLDQKPLVLYERRMIKEAQLFTQLLGATSLRMMSLLYWNDPFCTLFQLHESHLDHVPALASNLNLPLEPGKSPLPTTSLAVAKTSHLQDRDMIFRNTQAFITGEMSILCTSLNRLEQIRLTTWMNDFWDFAFVVAKHWDKDPASWAQKESLLIKNHKKRLLQIENHDPASCTIQRSSCLTPPPNRSVKISVEPEKLCRWTIHVPLEPDASKPMDESSCRRYEVIEISCNAETSVPEVSKGTFVGVAEPGTEATITTWKDNVAVQQPVPDHAPTLHEILSRALEAERFSRVGAQQLPIYASQVARAIRCSYDEMWKDSVRLAILGRNIELLDRTLCVSETRLKLIEEVYPLHLAATYLDGSKSCCQIMHYLLDRWLGDDWHLSGRSSAGYTLLDSLLLTILRNHSSAPVRLTDEALRDYPAFVGEEVNSCGMWDAESEVFRTHMKCGNRTVPESWKHKFCHTSILSVCHCIEAINAAGWVLQSSGLFLRCCLPCGMRLQLSPLHSIVFTTFLLAHYGCAGEDLFGMICCLLQYIIGCCRRSAEFAPLPISIDLLLDPSEQLGCTHRLLRPVELASQLGCHAQRLGVKSPKAWFAFVAVLHALEAQYLWAEQGIVPVGHTEDHRVILGFIKHKLRSRKLKKPLDDRILRSIFRHYVFRSECSSLDLLPCQHPDWYDPHRCFGRSRVLGHLWAACQAELLTYRRRSDSDPWLSSRFSIDQIFQLLHTGDPNSLSYVNQRLLQRYCICGMYVGWQTCPIREQVASYDFSNLDVPGRAEYLDAEKKEGSEEADEDKQGTIQEG